MAVACKVQVPWQATGMRMASCHFQAGWDFAGGEVVKVEIPRAPYVDVNKVDFFQW